MDTTLEILWFHGVKMLAAILLLGCQPTIVLILEESWEEKLNFDVSSFIIKSEKC